MGSRWGCLFSTLLLVQTQVCLCSRDAYLRSLGEKCKKSEEDSRLSYFSNYCFQYNTLSNIHHLLAFGEDLLQIGPIDLIYLKSVHPHPPPHTTETPPVIVYPENSAEQLRQSSIEIFSKELKKASGKTNLKQTPKDKDLGQKSSNISTIYDTLSANHLKRDADNGRLYRSDSVGNDGDYIEYEYGRDTERDRYGEDEKKQDYYYAGNIDEDFEDFVTNNVGSTRESIKGQTKKRFQRADRINGDKRVSSEIYRAKSNQISNENEAAPKNAIDGVTKHLAIKKDIGNRRVSETKSSPVKIIDDSRGKSSRISVRMIDGVTDKSLNKMVPESRALFRNEEDRRNVQVAKMTEERYFLNADHNEDVVSSSIEDLQMEDSEEHFTALPLQLTATPTAPIQMVPVHSIATSNPNTELDSGEALEARSDDTSPESIEEEATWTKTSRERNMTFDTVQDSDTKNYGENTQTWNENFESSPSRGSGNPTGSGNITEPNRSSQTVLISTSKDQLSKQPVNQDVNFHNEHQQVNFSEAHQHGDSFNAQQSFQHVNSSVIPQHVSSMKAMEASTWLGHLDEIAQQLGDIFSTYGITVPIPDWSEDLPAIIPLEEGKEQSTARRRPNKHSSTKKYMALFPLVAVIKFMIIKALLVPLLISVLIIKKIIILGVIAMPYVFSLLRVCRNGPGFGFLFNGGAGGGGAIGGNQVAANAPYLSAVDTSVDYAGGYGGHPASYKDFGGGARWIDRHYPNLMSGGGPGGKLGGEMGLVER